MFVLSWQCYGFGAQASKNMDYGLHTFIFRVTSLNSVSRMYSEKQIWRVVLPLVLIVLLLGMTSGMVWHHHVKGSQETCSLCHIAISTIVAGVRACVLVPVGTGPGHQYIRSIARATLRQIPARAPPA